MVLQTSVSIDTSDKQLLLYKNKINRMSHKQLLSEFVSYLDYKEESDSGRVFHPIEIGCCRALMIQPLDIVLKEMKRRSKL